MARMELPGLETQHLFYAEVKQHEDILIRDSAQDELLISPVAGGFFAGESMQGQVKGVGTGYTLTRLPDRNDITIRLLLMTDDGASIVMTSEGTLFLDPSHERRLIAGEEIAPGDYYYRVHLSFDTGSRKYSWLNGKCCFAVAGIKDWSTICYDAYLVK